MGRLNDYRDGSPGRGNQHEIKFVDKQVTHSEPRKGYSSRKSRGTPMKMLIAQEMCKETESIKKQPNVVARLMGLDDVPIHQSKKAVEYNYVEKKHKDVFDVWQKKARASNMKSHSFEKEFYMDIQNDMRMALVREKFMEAKRLVKGNKLLESKEFLDAVEVLSSNRDLFLECIEGPNSLFSKKLEKLHSYQTSTIPSVKESKLPYEKQNFPDKRPTRIVILKPNNPLKQNTASKDDFDQLSDIMASTKSMHIANGSVKEKSSSRRDESLLSSSVLSSGYVGDESSFNRSEIESKFSDLDTSRHSLDYSNRFGSPYSSSSYSRVFSSPEPSVMREAKRRLSERLSMLASTANIEYDRQSVSTIAEMLAIPEANKEIGVRRSFGSENDFHLTTSQASSSTCQSKESNMNLSRSRSVPVSSNFGLDLDVDSQAKKTSITKNMTESKRSFKSKLASLFSPKNKKNDKYRSVTSASINSREVTGKESDEISNSFFVSEPESCHPVSSEEESTNASSPVPAVTESKQESGSFTEVIHLEKPSTASEISEGLNQPSPTSILHASFDSDTSNTTSFSEVSDSKISTSPVDTNDHTLSWGGASFEASLSDTSDDTASFIHSILSISGFENKKLSDIFTNWHSVGSPLDPNVLDKYLDAKENYNNCWEMQSDRKFIFDCINYALLEISRRSYLSAYRCSRICCATRQTLKVDASIEDEVWLLINDWASNEHSEIVDYGVIVDRLVRNEVNGSKWSDMMHFEVAEVIAELSEENLNEVIEEIFLGQ